MQAAHQFAPASLLTIQQPYGNFYNPSFAPNQPPSFLNQTMQCAAPPSAPNFANYAPPPHMFYMAPQQQPQIYYAQPLYAATFQNTPVMNSSKSSTFSSPHGVTLIKDISPIVARGPRLPPRPIEQRKSPGASAPQEQPAGIPSNLALTYRTRLCSAFQMGRCEHGVQCRFAHSLEEMQHYRKMAQEVRAQMNPRFKTKLCRNFAPGTGAGYCPYLNRCDYLHPKDRGFEEALKRALNAFKKSPSPGQESKASVTTPPQELHDALEAINIQEKKSTRRRSNGSNDNAPGDNRMASRFTGRHLQAQNSFQQTPLRRISSVDNFNRRRSRC